LKSINATSVEEISTERLLISKKCLKAAKDSSKVDDLDAVVLSTEPVFSK